MIIRSNKERWTTVDNKWVRDITLSAKAKGILLYILSLPDDWDLHVNELVTHFTDGKDGIRSGMKELTDKGYLFCVPRKDETGKYIGNDYVVKEDPCVESPHTENPYTENPPLLSTNKKLSTNNTNSPLIKKIIKYLNEKTGKNFRPDNKQTIRMLNARLREGYSVNDIQSVIDIKTRKWHETEWAMYLRPKTLFGNKFESYVNEIDIEGAESRSSGAMPLQTLV